MGGQERQEKDGYEAVAGQEYKAPDIDETLSRSSQAMNKVRVVHGANEQYFENLDGKTVGQVRKSLREVFNIPGDADALVKGKGVGDDFVLEGGMNLEFVKEAGVKGPEADYLWELARARKQGNAEFNSMAHPS